MTDKIILTDGSGRSFEEEKCVRFFEPTILEDKDGKVFREQYDVLYLTEEGQWVLEQSVVEGEPQGDYSANLLTADDAAEWFLSNRTRRWRYEREL